MADILLLKTRLQTVESFASQQAQINAIYLNDGTAKLTDTFEFNHGDTWRVYFLNSICATAFVELSSAEQGEFKYIKVGSFPHNVNGVTVLRPMEVRSGLNVQLGLYYPTGIGKTNIVCNASGVISNYSNQDGGYCNGKLDNNFHFGNSHCVKVVKIS